MVPLCNSTGHCAAILQRLMEIFMDFENPRVLLSPFETVSVSRKNRKGCRFFFLLSRLEKKDEVQCLDPLDDN